LYVFSKIFLTLYFLGDRTMKKMLALVLVLAVAGLANAAMNLQISVGGNTALTEATVSPGSTLTLEITNAGNYVQPDDFAGFGLVVISGSGTISGGGVTAAAPSASGFDTDPANQADLAALFGGAGVYGTIASWTAGTFSGGQYFNGITFTCTGPGDVIIRLITTPDFENFSTADSLVVHQIPEPITMSLLGLGGLFLRKRK
jgi:hypothetical protein